MKTLLRKFPQTKLALFGVLLMTTAFLVSKASASVIIYSQDFPLDGNPLLGTTSTVGGGTWSGNNLFNIAGYTTGDGGAIALPFNPQSGYIYDLTATININPATTTWIGAGFLPSTGGDAYSFLATPNTPTAVRNGDAWTTFPGGVIPITSADLRIRLDTTGSNWVSSFYQGGVQMGSAYTYTSGNPTINYVGFVNAEGGGVGGISAFQLTAAVAGPVTLTNTVVGASLVLSWPNGQGWVLEAQTNNLSTGLVAATNAWTRMGAATSPFTNSVNPANGSVFYRLVYP